METTCSHMFNVRLELQSRLDCMIYFVHCTGNENCHMLFCSTAPIPISFDLFYPHNLNPSITFKISGSDCIDILKTFILLSILLHCCQYFTSKWLCDDWFRLITGHEIPGCDHQKYLELRSKLK